MDTGPVNPPANGLRQLRLDAKLSQSQIAAKVGISTSRYRHYEHGRRRMTADLAIRIADALDVSVRAVAAKT